MGKAWNSTLSAGKGFKSRAAPLKRSGTLKSKVVKKAPRKRLRRQSTQTLSAIQRTLWQAIRHLVREKYGTTCYTCGQTGLEKQNWQCGHMWPKAALGAFLKYDIRVLRPQCFRCNIHLGGNGAEFYKRVLAEIGAEKMAQLEADRRIITKALPHYQFLLTQLESGVN